MAKSQRPRPNSFTSFFEGGTWKAITILFTAGTAIAVAGFTVGIKYEEANSNLKAVQALQACNEKIEHERAIITSLRNELTNKVLQDLTNTVNYIKAKQDGSKGKK